MPKLNVEMFDEAPSKGDEVTIKGKVLSIDQDSGDVEVSYDVVTSKTKEEEGEDREEVMEEKGEEASYKAPESLDEALGKAFQKTQ